MITNATGIYAGSKIPHTLKIAIEHAIIKGELILTPQISSEML